MRCIKKRNFISSLYQKNLSKEFIELPFITKNTTSSFHLYVIKLKKAINNDILDPNICKGVLPKIRS